MAAELKKDIFNEIWFLYKRHLNLQGDDAWDVLISEENALLEKYNCDPFCKDLIYSVNNELGRG